METLQTLERGLLALEQIAQHHGQLSIAQLAEKLAINRTNAYRIAWTLSQSGYIKINEKQCLELSSKVVNLYQRYEASIPPMSQEVLDHLAQVTDGCAALAIAEQHECVVIKSAASTASHLKINYQVGSRHPIGIAAAGIAIALTYPASPQDNDAVKAARELGYGFSQNQLQQGTQGYFLPIPHRHMAIGIVSFNQQNLEQILQILQHAVKCLA